MTQVTPRRPSTRWLVPLLLPQVLLYALLAGDNRTVEFLSRAGAQGVMDTLEDYMWVKLQLLQPPPPSAAAAGSTSSPGLGGSSLGLPCYSLKDLQVSPGPPHVHCAMFHWGREERARHKNGGRHVEPPVCVARLG